MTWKCSAAGLACLVAILIGMFLSLRAISAPHSAAVSTIGCYVALSSDVALLLDRAQPDPAGTSYDCERDGDAPDKHTASTPGIVPEGHR
jgi:hypothetical protein